MIGVGAEGDMVNCSPLGWFMLLGLLSIGNLTLPTWY